MIANSQTLMRLGRMLDRPWLAWGVLAVSSLLFLGLWYSASIDYAERARTRFDLRAKVQQAELAERMMDYMQILNGGAGLFEASDWVSRQEWHRYIHALELGKARPGMLGTGFAQLVAPEDRARHEARIRAEGFPDYAMYPPGERPVYSAIIYLEPFTPENQRAFGFDMLSEPVRREAMERARDTGEPALSGKVVLVQGGPADALPGFLIYHPVYRNGAPIDTPEKRRAALLGFVYSPFRASDVFDNIFKTSAIDVRIEIFDGPPRPENRLYSSEPGGRHARHVVEVESVIAGRSWTLRLFSSPEFEAQTDSAQPTLILVGGLSFSLLLFALIFLLGRYSQRVAQTAEELQRGHEELRAASQYARSLLEASLDPLVTIDAAGRISDANRATEDATGIPRGHLIGTDFSACFTDPARAEAAYRQVFEAGTVRDYPLTLRHTSGRLTEVLYNAAVYCNASGEVAGVFAAARDVTAANAAAAELERHRHHLEELVHERTQELSLAKEAAEAAADAKSAFLAKMSHELRTPMNGVIGIANILKRGATEPRQKERLQKLLDASNHLLALINDILDYVHLDTAQIKLYEQDFRPRELVAEVAQVLRNSADLKGLRLDTTVDDAVPEILSGDALRIRQVLLKLVENAVKFTEQGTVHIQLRVRPQQGKPVLQFEVSDTGIGISADDQKRLFRHFEQTDNALSRRYGGSGIGLAISRRLVGLMGGLIGCDSEPGKGSRFWFYVPLHPAGAAATAEGTPSEPCPPTPHAPPEPPPPDPACARHVSPPPPECDTAHGARLGGELHALLAGSDFAAFTFWQKHQNALAPLLQSAMPAFAAAMDSFDNERALTLLGQALAASRH